MRGSVCGCSPHNIRSSSWRRRHRLRTADVSGSKSSDRRLPGVFGDEIPQMVRAWTIDAQLASRSTSDHRSPRASPRRTPVMARKRQCGNRRSSLVHAKKSCSWTAVHAFMWSSPLSLGGLTRLSAATLLTTCGACIVPAQLYLLGSLARETDSPGAVDGSHNLAPCRTDDQTPTVKGRPGRMRRAALVLSIKPADGIRATEFEPIIEPTTSVHGRLLGHPGS